MMIMTFKEFLATVTEEERDFVARLDYGQDHGNHRKALDHAITNGGVVDIANQGVWFPLEVLELGRNALQPGHEREFVLCAGIVLQSDKTGDEAEDLMQNHADEIRRLPEDLRSMLEGMITEMQRNPKGVRFADLCRVCEKYFGQPRQKGTSHRIYRTPWQGDPRVNIQDDISSSSRDSAGHPI
jgi:hypothetical protein